MSPASTLAQPKVQLAEREWDKLMNIIAEGCVVPVLGPELLTVSGEGGEQTLYQIWGKQLAQDADLPLSQESATPALYQVTNELSQIRNSNDLAYDIDDVLRRRNLNPIPESLKLLAGIKSFPLFITTTVDHLLKEALDQAHGDGGETVNQIVFRPRGKKSEIDLPEDFAYARAPAVFHLFGATSQFEGTFAKTEDDLIEFSWSLLDRQYAPERLYDYLQQRTVLLLGCNFPDWLGRFFIHALNAGRHDAAINIYHVSGRREPGFEDFLRRKRAKVLLVQSPVAFVKEMDRRWQLRLPAATPVAVQPQEVGGEAANFKRGAVFLSYASENRDVVRSIRTQLEEAQIDTWMDDRELQPGDEYERKIHEHIRDASSFLAIVSRAHESPDKPGRFVWKEWRWAEQISMERRKEDNYLQALVVDDTPPGARFIEEPYRSLHWADLRHGRVPQELIDRLKGGIKKFRRSK